MFKLKKSTYRYSSRFQSKKGLLSAIVAAISFVTLITLSILSSRSGGNGGLFLGGIGIVAFILSLVGFVLGLQSLREEEIYYSIPVIGTSVNTILFVIYIIIYMTGTFL